MKITDLKYLEWSKVRDSSGTAGSYLKSYSYIDGIKRYYKLSFFDDVNKKFGYESINEIIVSRILDELGYDHVNYELSYSKVVIEGIEYITYVSSSLDYKKPNETKTTFESFYKMNRNNDEDIISFISRYGFTKEVYQMIIIDYITSNRDRHGANIELLYNQKTNTWRMAPLFDHGLSLLSPSYLDKDIEEYDIKKDVKANSFIGTSNLEENLKLVPTSFFPSIKIDFDNLIDSLDIDEKMYLNKVKELLKWRWSCLENIRNSR